MVLFHVLLGEKENYGVDDRKSQRIYCPHMCRCDGWPGGLTTYRGGPEQGWGLGEQPAHLNYSSGSFWGEEVGAWGE